MTTVDLRLTLPERWRAQLPPDVSASSAFGSYHETYEQVGPELHLSHRVVGTTEIQPPGGRKTMIAWMRELAKNDAKLIVIEAVTHPAR